MEFLHGCGQTISELQTAEDSSMASGLPSDDTQESHEAIWAAMPTVIIRDCEPNSQAAPPSQAWVHVNDQTPGRSLVDIDDSSSSSDGSSDSETISSGPAGGGAAPDSTASTGGPPLDSAEGDDEALTLHDLLGVSNEADADLPTVEEERLRLEDLARRRQAVQAITARYTSEVRPTPQSRPREIMRSLSSAIGLTSNGWEIGGVSTAPLVATVTQLATVESAPTTTRVNEDVISVPQITLADDRQPEEVHFTALETLDDVDGDAEVDVRVACIGDGFPRGGARYIVDETQGLHSSVTTVHESCGEVDSKLQQEDRQADADVQAKAVSKHNKSRRPWDPAARPMMGPAAPHNPAQASAMLERLGERFRESGLARTASSVTNTTDIINILGARLGELDDHIGTAAATNSSCSRESHRPDAKFKVGENVVLVGLSAADLNGQLGTVIRASGKTNPGRLPVQLSSSGKKILVKEENLEAPQTTELVLGRSVMTESRFGSQAEQTENRASGGRDASDVDARHTTPAPEEAPGQRDEAVQGSFRPAWPFSQEKMLVGRDSDARLQEELWIQFLAGDDQPVGGDGLPPPELYYRSARGGSCAQGRE